MCVNFFRLQCYIWMDGMGWMANLGQRSSKSTFGANNCMGWSVFTKRGLGARLSCSEEDFATEKCRSIDRLAEKGFCNKSSNKPSLLNRKQFPRASSYIPDTNWPFKWSLRKVIDYFQLFFISIKPIIAMHCHSRTIAEKCSFVIKKNVRKCSCGFINRMGVIIYIFTMSKLLMTTSLCALVICFLTKE